MKDKWDNSTICWIDEMNMNKLILTYDDVVRYCINMASVIALHKPTLIVGIARGGLVPAVHLSHALDVPLETLIWQTRDGTKQIPNPVITEAIQNGGVVVFVDDINDSGKTFRTIKEYYKAGITACIIEKMYSEFECDFAGAKTYNKDWVCFPWEKN
jgi:hypoxanthine phosphoribosyltransferase